MQTMSSWQVSSRRGVNTAVRPWGPCSTPRQSFKRDGERERKRGPESVQSGRQGDAVKISCPRSWALNTHPRFGAPRRVDVDFPNGELRASERVCLPVSVESTSGVGWLDSGGTRCGLAAAEPHGAERVGAETAADGGGGSGAGCVRHAGVAGGKG